MCKTAAILQRHDENVRIVQVVFFIYTIMLLILYLFKLDILLQRQDFKVVIN